jgi:hypothetical protein
MVVAGSPDLATCPTAGLHPDRTRRSGDLRSGGGRGPRPAPNRAYTARNAEAIHLRSAVYDSADATVALIAAKPFALSKPVQIVIDGLPPSGLQDGPGRLIDGDHNGTPGGDTVAILSRGGVSIGAIASGTVGGPSAGIMAVVDALFEQDAHAGLTKPHPARRDRVLPGI